MLVVFAEQIDVLSLFHVPVIQVQAWVPRRVCPGNFFVRGRALGGQGGLISTGYSSHLRREEHQIGEQACTATIPIGERMDAHTVGVCRDAQFSGRPVIGVLEPPRHVVQRRTQFRCDLRRIHTDADIMAANCPRPCPKGLIQAAVQMAKEVIGKDISQLQFAGVNLSKQVLSEGDLQLLFQVLNIRPHDRLVQ